MARIHNYINTKEAEKSLPGCRTVVASGLRKHFEDRQGRDDFFAANFSLSVAYEAQAKGSAIGLKGNCLYVEDDVAVAVSYVEECHAILASAKFLPLSFPLVDPYHYYPEMQSSVTVRSGTWNVHEPIVVPIMNQERVFRRLNPSALTNLQLFADYRRIVLNKYDRHDMIRDALSRATPTLEKINTPFGDWGDSLFPRLCFPLDMDYKKFFGRRQVRRRRNSTP